MSNTYEYEEVPNDPNPENQAILRKYVFLRPRPTADQQKLIDQLRSRLEDLIADSKNPISDEFLMRFLVSRRWDVTKAEEMYRNAKIFREKTFPLKLAAENMMRNLRFGSFELTDIRDRYNRPLMITTNVRHNPSLYPNMDNNHNGYLWGTEMCLRLLEPPYNQFVYIVDVNQAQLRNWDASVMKSVGGLARDYFPDYMGNTFIINYPWGIQALWKLADLLLEKRTRDKVHFLPREEYLKLFPVLFDPEYLYERFGGRRKERLPTETEFDPEVLQLFKKAEKLSGEDRERYFEPELEKAYAKLDPEEVAFWREVQLTSTPLSMRDHPTWKRDRELKLAATASSQSADPAPSD